VLWFSTALDDSNLSSQTPQLVLNPDVEVTYENPDQSHQVRQTTFDHYNFQFWGSQTPLA